MSAVVLLCAAQARERALVELLIRYLTPLQAAHLLEQWEAIERDHPELCLPPAPLRR